MKRKIVLFLVLVLVLTSVMTASADSGGVTLASREGVTVYGPIGLYAAPGDSAWGSVAKSAVIASAPSQWPTLDGAEWISTAFETETPTQDTWRWFHDELKIACTAYDISPVKVTATADNAEEFYLNGVLIGSDGTVQGPVLKDNWEWSTLTNYPITPHAGTNALDFIVRNYGVADSTATTNPTGLIYKTDAAVTYKVAEVVWQPPLTHQVNPPDGARLPVLNGSTLPLKFKIYRDGTLLTSMLNLRMEVSGPDGFTATWNLGEGTDALRFDPTEGQYIGNFHTKNYNLKNGTYTAKVLDDCGEWSSISFEVVAGNGSGK